MKCTDLWLNKSVELIEEVITGQALISSSWCEKPHAGKRWTSLFPRCSCTYKTQSILCVTVIWGNTLKFHEFIITIFSHLHLFRKNFSRSPSILNANKYHRCLLTAGLCSLFCLYWLLIIAVCVSWPADFLVLRVQAVIKASNGHHDDVFPCHVLESASDGNCPSLSDHLRLHIKHCSGTLC